MSWCSPLTDVEVDPEMTNLLPLIGFGFGVGGRLAGGTGQTCPHVFKYREY